MKEFSSNGYRTRLQEIFYGKEVIFIGPLFYSWQWFTGNLFTLGSKASLALYIMKNLRGILRTSKVPISSNNEGTGFALILLKSQ